MTVRKSQIIVSVGAGLVFGFGLSLSGMLDPIRVQGFLDVFGAWDSSLAFVLGGAVAVAFVGLRVGRRMPRPILDTTFHFPVSTSIDARLIAGSALFGLGWGLGGLCPGPAVASLSLGLWQTWLFALAMLAGMIFHDRFFKRMRP
ncbi:YeeE/YedE family protein [Mesorhizobium sp. M0166]|uniref:DUF6691 family protein n=1 Tax=unclassified Mesorhizobium TaxID=325217 RepID=UPI003337F5CD